MDLNNLTEQAKQAAKEAMAKVEGNATLNNAKDAIVDGIGNLKDKLGGDNSGLAGAAKEKLSDVLHKGADLLDGLADKVK